MSGAQGPDHPLVSVVTVCLNAEKTIRRTIDSVLAQTYPNLEYLVVDGGSTDRTLDILRSYEGRLSFTSEPDRGMYDAMNKGIRRVRGKWIHLVNADDWYATPDALALAVPQLTEDRTNYFDLVRVYPDREPVLQSRTVARWMLYIAAFLPHPTLIVSREQYERVGLYDPELRIASDHDLILRMIRNFPPKHIPMVLSNMDQTGVSARALSTSLEEFTQVTIRHGVPAAIARTIQWLKSYWWGLRTSAPMRH
jgi:glycosyltransferase involved in cell wall biosynthesis